MKKIIASFLLLSLLMILWVVFQEKILELKYFIGYTFSTQYQKDRQLIEPYFDQNFYLEHYGEAVKKSGLTPIDHFLSKGWYSNNWRNHTDPNPWFNTTLYQERLWNKSSKLKTFWQKLFEIKNNPLVDFLNQPKLHEHKPKVEIFAKKMELTRAWLATEGLIRLDKFKVILHIEPNAQAKDLIRFVPQVKRGLELQLDNEQNISFYHSDFIRHPNKYQLIDSIPQKTIEDGDAIIHLHQNYHYFVHRLYNYTSWLETGKINPTLINFAHFCYEPFASAPYFGGFSQRLSIILQSIGRSGLRVKLRAQNLKDYIVRIAEGFDLCFIGAKLPIPNLKIIPGPMAAWVDTRELNKNKEFSVSFLHTKQFRNNPVWNYRPRIEVWDRENEFKITTRFYLSYRDKDKYPKNLQNRIMPTYSKKWIYNSQFSIAIENIQQEYYFTEKLLGCFISLTIPIYFGCPNITEYFDPRGMIIVQSTDDIIKAANSLAPSTYQKMLPYLKENKRRALKLLNLEKDTITQMGARIK